MAAPAPAPFPVPPPSSSVAARQAPAPQPSVWQFVYTGVERSLCGRHWMATVLDPAQGGADRVIGAFPDEHAAALAHDLVEIVLHGDGEEARLNVRPAFHDIERRFLLGWGTTWMAGFDICTVVAEGSYESWYAGFLRTVFKLHDYGEFFEIISDFYLDRAAEIGRPALLAGGEKLIARFIAMHKNRAIDPVWLREYHNKIAETQFQFQRQQQLLQGQFIF